MFDKFDHKFRDSRYYNFVIVFAGTFFAIHLILPDEWRKTLPLILVILISAAVAKFAASNRNRN